MDSTHNPDRFMADLRQILSQGRKRIGFLVGAGAPLSIRIDANRNVSDTGNPLIPGIDDLTRAALTGLTPEQNSAIMATQQQLGPGATIEAILSQLRLMERALGTQALVGLNGPGYAALAKAICSNIGKIVGPDLPMGRCGYNELVGWISGTQRSKPVEIFTTN